MASQIVDEAAARGDDSPSQVGKVPLTLTAEQKAAVKACDFLTNPDFGEETERFPVAAYIPMFNTHMLTFGISSDEMGAAGLRQMAFGLFRAATALNHVVTVRGDNDEDMPGTLEHAMHGVNFLMSWGNALAGAAASGLYGEGA